MAPDHSPEGRQKLTAAEEDEPNIEERLLMEDSDNEPGGEVEAIAAEEEQAPGAESDEEHDPADEVDDDSIESIVQDLKRERGQSQ